MRNIAKTMIAVLVMLGLAGFINIGKAQEVSGPVPWVSHLKGKDDTLMVKQPDTDWFEATVNTPIGEGDVVFQDKGGRSEIYIDKGTYLRLDSESAVKFDRLSEGEVRVTLTKGKVVAGNGAGSDLLLDVPGQTVVVGRGSKARVSVNDFGDTEVVARRGRVTVEGPRGSFRLDKGNTLTADEHGENVKLARSFKADGFDTWSDGRDAALVVVTPPTTVVTYMPEPVVADLSVHGVWVNDPGYGWVWRPRVVVGWTPYRDGRWVYRPSWGWTWVSYEPWGWYPYHYGRWVHVNSGWCWVPVHVRAHWSPALVFWVEGPDYIAWQPLPFNVTLAMTWHWGPTHVHRYVNHHHITVVHYHDFHRGHYHNHCVRDWRPAGHTVYRVVRSPQHVAHKSIDVKHHRTPRPSGYVQASRAPKERAVYAHHRTSSNRANTQVARVNYGRSHNAVPRNDAHTRNVSNPRVNTNKGRAVGHTDARPSMGNDRNVNRGVKTPADRSYGARPENNRSRPEHAGTRPAVKDGRVENNRPDVRANRSYGARPDARTPEKNAPANRNKVNNNRPAAKPGVNQPRTNERHRASTPVKPQHNRSGNSAPRPGVSKPDHNRAPSSPSPSSVKSSRPSSPSKSYSPSRSSSSKSRPKPAPSKSRSHKPTRSRSSKRPR